mmetsp:Transcript_2566/g.3692  ORF Transcript_2566/g.3692 Transcript_2566/m.3692 type:complete len:108 (-) Transcript_2566:656-979(-)
MKSFLKYLFLALMLEFTHAKTWLETCNVISAQDNCNGNCVKMKKLKENICYPLSKDLTYWVKPSKCAGKTLLLYQTSDCTGTVSTTSSKGCLSNSVQAVMCPSSRLR